MRTFSLILAAGLLTLSVNAQSTPQRDNTQNTQDPQGGTWKPLMMDDNTARTLNLTPEQQQGWRERSALYERDYNGLQPGATNYDLDRQRWYDRRNTDMKKFLTADQYKQWQQLDTRPTTSTGTAPGSNKGANTTTPSRPKQ
jgi:hypothetical protein